MSKLPMLLISVCVCVYVCVCVCVCVCVSVVLELGISGVGREACKRGCPTARRRELWSLALGVDTSHETVCVCAFFSLSSLYFLSLTLCVSKELRVSTAETPIKDTLKKDTIEKLLHKGHTLTFKIVTFLSSFYL